MHLISLGLRVDMHLISLGLWPFVGRYACD